ncbi:MAG: DUF2089 family protein [Phycisphaerae bacterium]|nr:DUF2089 family protein [Phycisphaerae bacterium]MDD5380425.1 DUF2089 family protein [Phycisphaerae bacterium]
MKVLPAICPSCSSLLNVKSLVCQRCQTEIQGQYELPLLARLSTDDEGFVLEFIKASGSLKEMAKLLGLSYPTVRNRLDEVIERIKFTEKGGKEGKEKKL